MAHATSSLYIWSGLRNPQVLADFQDKQLIDFAVAWYCTTSIELGLMPPRVVASLSQQFTAMKAEMAQQISAFHRVRASSS